MGNPVVHFEVIGKDAAALQRFYGDAFGWKIEPAGPSYAMAIPGTEGAINGGIGSPHVTFYVEVASLDDALATIKRLGGKCCVEPMDVPGGPRIAMFADPEGHVVGLVQARPVHA